MDSTHANPNPVPSSSSDSDTVEEAHVILLAGLRPELESASFFAQHEIKGGALNAPPCLFAGAPSFFDEDKIKGRVLPLPVQIEQQHKRLANLIDTGIHNLLLPDSAGNLIISPHSLLCLQVILRIGHEKLEGEYRDLAESIVPDAQPPTYELSVEDATGVLLDYENKWIHSLSMVLVDLNGWKDKVDSCDLQCRAQATESSNHTEVTLFVLADYEIDDQVIGNREKLKDFLEELGKKQMLKLHVTCSSVAYGGEKYSHVIV